jgi:hypothetical protein
MQRSISRWTTALAAAALLALPAAAGAQSQGEQQRPTSQNTATSDTPAAHVQAAKQALESIPKSSIPAADRAKFAQLRTHLNNLERDVANCSGASMANCGSSAQAAAPAASSRRGARARAASSGNWGTEVAAIDRIITELTGSEAGENASASAPAPTGTSGRASARVARSSRSAALDEQARSQLNDVRRHITELASSMSGASSGAANRAEQGAGSMTGANPDTMASRPSQSSQTSATTTPPAGTGTQSSASSAQPSAGTSPSTAPSPSTASSAQSPSAQPSSTVDAAAAKQHLTEARDTLSQITSMPQAARLQGEARTQVSQLISNFNELITTQSNWRSAYDKVEANLNALLGPEGSEPSPSATGTTGTTAPAPTTGTSPTTPSNPSNPSNPTNPSTGATGTTGTTAGATPSTAASGVQVDPAVRAKLVEFRTHLKAFEQAASGGSSGSGSTPDNMTAATTSGSTSSSPSTPPSVSTGSTSSPAPSAPAPSAAGTSGTGTPSATGTSGTYIPPSSADESQASAKSDLSQAGKAKPEVMGHSDAERHLDAISEILNKAKNGALDKAQTDELKMHVEQLRQLLKQSGKESK